MNKFKKICACIMSLTILFATPLSFATTDYSLTSSVTEEYIRWQSLSDDEKKETIIPRITTLNFSNSNNSENTLTGGLREQIINGNFEKDPITVLVGVNGYEKSSFNLNEKINVEVKHQGGTNECWAFSTTSVLETNLALTKNINKKFSVRHMDYSLVRNFKDGINYDTYNREPGIGGLPEFGLAYLTSGKGAVLDKDMEFVNDDKSLIYLSELNKNVDTIATDTVSFPELYKKYDSNGNITYTNGGIDDDLKVYSEKEVKDYRNAIKNHLYRYGAISAVTAGNKLEFYSNQTNPAKSQAYFCNDNRAVRDHAITIVGWDDNYSRDNFTGVAKPANNGAYICLNSYGNTNFYNGYIYISYEDALIETCLYGIKSSTEVDYKKLYQYNPTGENVSLGMPGNSKGYIAEVFNRNVSNKEILKYIGINIPKDLKLKIYVNSTGNNPAIASCKLVATTDILSAGYHRIPIEETNLTGNFFTVVIEEISYDNRFDFSAEIGIANSIYSTLEGNPEKSLFSLDGNSWSTLSSQKIVGFDMTKADMTIKAFTIDEKSNYEEKKDNTDTKEEQTPKSEEQNPKTEDEKITFTTTIYDVKENDIYKIAYNTKVKEFKKRITTNSKEIEFVDNTNKKISDEDIIKTGTTMKLSDGTIYTLIVRGDINCDGKISLIDLSKIVAHYGDEKKYGLTGYSKKAADLNCDNFVSLVDVSQMVQLLGNI